MKNIGLFSLLIMLFAQTTLAQKGLKVIKKKDRESIIATIQHDVRHTKDTYSATLADGKKIIATKNHPSGVKSASLIHKSGKVDTIDGLYFDILNSYFEEIDSDKYASYYAAKT